MASITLGRVNCPISCGHTAAQVKLKTDKGEKTAHPYIHCAGCGVQVHARNAEQGNYIKTMMRPVDAPKPPEEVPAPSKPIPAPVARPLPEKTPVAPPGKPAGLFGVNWGG